MVVAALLVKIFCVESYLSKVIVNLGIILDRSKKSVSEMLKSNANTLSGEHDPYFEQATYQQMKNFIFTWALDG